MLYPKMLTPLKMKGSPAPPPAAPEHARAHVPRQRGQGAQPAEHAHHHGSSIQKASAICNPRNHDNSRSPANPRLSSQFFKGKGL